MLLLSLNRLALRLHPLRTPGAIITGIGWVALVWVLVSGEKEYSLFLRATLMLTLWSLLLVAFISLFQTIPTPPLPALKWRDRVLMSIRLWLFRFMALAFLVLVISVAGISVKLMMLG